MTNSNPQENHDDQLLSAYIDGELGGGELARVEQRLRTDTEAQKLVADLQALSTTLRALPRDAVEVSLRESVLQQIDSNLSPRREERSNSARRWIWASAAIAAALLLSVYLPTAQRDEGEVAVAKPELEQELVLEASEGTAPAVRADVSISSSFADEAPRQNLAPRQNSQPALIVHLTLNRGVPATSQLDQLMTSQGIVFENQVEERLHQRSRSMQTESILVEAPIEQIEQLLEASNNDTLNYASVRVDAPDPKIVPLAQWQQWERGAKIARKKLGILSRTTSFADESESTGGGLGGDGGLSMAKQTKAKTIKKARLIRVLFYLHSDEPRTEPTSSSSPVNE